MRFSGDEIFWRRRRRELGSRILLNESHLSVQTLKKDPHYPVLNLLLILLEEEFVEVLAFVGVEEDIRGGIDNVFSPLDQGILRGKVSSLVECLSLFNGLGLALLASRNSELYRVEYDSRRTVLGGLTISKGDMRSDQFRLKGRDEEGVVKSTGGRMSAWLLGPLSGSHETDLSLFLGLRRLDIAGESF